MKDNKKNYINFIYESWDIEAKCVQEWGKSTGLKATYKI